VDELDRFVTAQGEEGWEGILGEMRSGRKTGHWIWFVFPQLRGLGLSGMSQRYGIAGIDEARAYLAHPVLGPRLREAVEIVAGHQGRTAVAIFGAVDATKFRSSLTLFAAAAAEPGVFGEALTQFYAGTEDPLTRRMLEGGSLTRR
jgi:uncharacterized protein (DUF1810 family)